LDKLSQKKTYNKTIEIIIISRRKVFYLERESSSLVESSGEGGPKGGELIKSDKQGNNEMWRIFGRLKEYEALYLSSRNAEDWVDEKHFVVGPFASPDNKKPNNEVPRPGKFPQQFVYLPPFKDQVEAELYLKNDAFVQYLGSIKYVPSKYTLEFKYKGLCIDATFCRNLDLDSDSKKNNTEDLDNDMMDLDNDNTAKKEIVEKKQQLIPRFHMQARCADAVDYLLTEIEFVLNETFGIFGVRPLLAFTTMIMQKLRIVHSEKLKVGKKYPFKHAGLRSCYFRHLFLIFLRRTFLLMGSSTTEKSSREQGLERRGPKVVDKVVAPHQTKNWNSRNLLGVQNTDSLGEKNMPIINNRLRSCELAVSEKKRDLQCPVGGSSRVVDFSDPAQRAEYYYATRWDSSSSGPLPSSGKKKKKTVCDDNTNNTAQHVVPKKASSKKAASSISSTSPRKNGEPPQKKRKKKPTFTPGASESTQASSSSACSQQLLLLGSFGSSSSLISKDHDPAMITGSLVDQLQEDGNNHIVNTGSTTTTDDGFHSDDVSESDDDAHDEDDDDDKIVDLLIEVTKLEEKREELEEKMIQNSKREQTQQQTRFDSSITSKLDQRELRKLLYENAAEQRLLKARIRKLFKLCESVDFLKKKYVSCDFIGGGIFKENDGTTTSTWKQLQLCKDEETQKKAVVLLGNNISGPTVPKLWDQEKGDDNYGSRGSNVDPCYVSPGLFEASDCLASGQRSPPFISENFLGPISEAPMVCFPDEAAFAQMQKSSVQMRELELISKSTCCASGSTATDSVNETNIVLDEKWGDPRATIGQWDHPASGVGGPTGGPPWTERPGPLAENGPPSSWTEAEIAADLAAWFGSDTTSGSNYLDSYGATSSDDVTLSAIGAPLSNNGLQWAPSLSSSSSSQNGLLNSVVVQKNVNGINQDSSCRNLFSDKQMRNKLFSSSAGKSSTKKKGAARQVCDFSRAPTPENFEEHIDLQQEYIDGFDSCWGSFAQLQENVDNNNYNPTAILNNSCTSRISSSSSSSSSVALGGASGGSPAAKAIIGLAEAEVSMHGVHDSHRAMHGVAGELPIVHTNNTTPHIKKESLFSTKSAATTTTSFCGNDPVMPTTSYVNQRGCSTGSSVCEKNRENTEIQKSADQKKTSSHWAVEPKDDEKCHQGEEEEEDIRLNPPPPFAPRAFESSSKKFEDSFLQMEFEKFEKIPLINNLNHFRIFSAFMRWLANCPFEAAVLRPFAKFSRNTVLRRNRGDLTKCEQPFKEDTPMALALPKHFCTNKNIPEKLLAKKWFGGGNSSTSTIEEVVPRRIISDDPFFSQIGGQEAHQEEEIKEEDDEDSKFSLANEKFNDWVCGMYPAWYTTRSLSCCYEFQFLH